MSCIDIPSPFLRLRSLHVCFPLSLLHLATLEADSSIPKKEEIWGEVFKKRARHQLLRVFEIVPNIVQMKKG